MPAWDERGGGTGAGAWGYATDPKTVYEGQGPSGGGGTQLLTDGWGYGHWKGDGPGVPWDLDAEIYEEENEAFIDGYNYARDVFD